MIGRRSFITGLVSLVAAPAIVRAGSLMPVKCLRLQNIVGTPDIGFVAGDHWLHTEAFMAAFANHCEHATVINVFDGKTWRVL